jgi:hypothetical protein
MTMASIDAKSGFVVVESVIKEGACVIFRALTIVGSKAVDRTVLME